MDIIDKKKEKNMRGRAGDRTLGHLHSRRTPKAGILPLDHTAGLTFMHLILYRAVTFISCTLRLRNRKRICCRDTFITS